MTRELSKLENDISGLPVTPSIDVVPWDVVGVLHLVVAGQVHGIELQGRHGGTWWMGCCSKAGDGRMMLVENRLKSLSQY